MGNRNSSHSPTPEELLDSWLDALNEQGGVPPEPPEGIAGLASIARRYDHALGMKGTGRTIADHHERNGSMTPQFLIDAVPVAIPRQHPTRPTRSQPSPRASFSGVFTTATMIVLMLALAGGGFIYQIAINGGDDRSPDRIALMAPATATPETGSLACESPGYVPIVEGDMNEETLASIGINETPLHVDGDTFHIPTSSGEVADLPSNWVPIVPGTSLWSDVHAQERSEESTVLDVETGNEWTFSDPGSFTPPPFEDPYLVLAETYEKKDWRIVDTVTGEERLVSDVRGAPFEHQMNVTMVTLDWYEEGESDTRIWIFMPNYDAPENVNEAYKTLGPNVLVMGDSLDDASFLPVTVDSRNSLDSVYSASTGQLAYPINADNGRDIVIVNMETGKEMVIRDERFTEEALPLMYLKDGSALIVDQPGTLFSVSLAGDAQEITVLHEGDGVVPIAVNRETSTIVVKYLDQHIAMVNGVTSEVIDMPEVTERQIYPFEVHTPLRGSSDLRIATLFDEEAGMARVINLLTGHVSEPVSVLNPSEDMIQTALVPGFGTFEEFPYTEWSDGYGYVDAEGVLHAISMDDQELWTTPAPEDLEVGDDQLVQILVNPSENCLILNVAQAGNLDEITVDWEREPGRVTSWIAAMKPGASWTKLDISITGWWEMPEQSERLFLPAPDVGTPVASPESS
jgi:hypothetical protein